MRISVAVLVGACLLGCASPVSAMKTPETSACFEKFTDPGSGVVSYVLKPGLVGYNQQSLYFTQKSMTDDGRFLVFTVSPDERTWDRKRGDAPKDFALVDFAADRAWTLARGEKFRTSIPCVDCREDRLYYIDTRDGTNDWFCYRDLRNDPDRERRMFKMPRIHPEGSRFKAYYTHLTLSDDRKYAFLDARYSVRGVGHSQGVEGLLDLATGQFVKWCEVPHNADHGQINPVRNDLALGAWEGVKPHTNGVGQTIYPRMWLYAADGRYRNVPSQDILHATHEIWADDGTYFYWCSRDPKRDRYGVYAFDLATKRERLIAAEKAMHAMISYDNARLVYDWPLPPTGRGSAWMMSYKDLRTGKVTDVFTRRPPLSDPVGSSTLHPDPHPQFVMKAKYIVSTMNGEDMRMNLAVTPVAQFDILRHKQEGAR